MPIILCVHRCLQLLTAIQYIMITICFILLIAFTVHICFYTFTLHAFRVETESPLLSNTTILAYFLTSGTPCKKKAIITWVMFCLSFSCCLILFKSSNDKTDYAELLFPQRQPKPNASFPQNKSPQLNRRHPVMQEEIIPPALPYRPNDLLDSTVPSPNSQPNRLYPCLKEEFSDITSPPPTMVIMTRLFLK